MPDDELEGTAWDRAIREHEESLAIGNRVRIRLGECPHLGSWHGTREDGVIGTVVGTDITTGSGAPPGHRFFVWFDWPLLPPGGCLGWSYLAIELIPIPAPDI